ncbi:MAG: hypothetical protein FJ290_27290 [Planctomycetes bacterium]|nr:hypothetical protein [Planctomycetota bacterium]
MGPPVVPRPKPSDLGGRSVSYSVLRITDHNGCVHFEAVETRSVREREKLYHEAYLKAARGWKPGQDPKSPLQQPRKPEVRVWRNVMGGPDAWDRAHAIADECRKKELKGDAKPDAKSDAAPESDPAKAPSPPVDPKKVPGPLVK